MNSGNKNLESHFKLSLTKSSSFPYKSINKEIILLYRHQELPQDYKYIDPRLSPNEKYLSVIAKGKNDDFVLIYEIENLNEYKYIYHNNDNIFGVDFAPDSRSFVIIYKNISPIHYNIISGKKIICFKDIKKNNFLPISSSFSQKCRFFALAFNLGFCIWDSLKGNIVKFFEEESDNKIIRDTLLISINQQCNVKIINFQSENNQIIKNFNISNIDYFDILAVMLSPNLEYIFIGLKNSIIKMEIESGEFEKIIEFKNEVSSIKLSQNCEFGISTNYKNIDLWNLKNKKNIGSIMKQPFNSYTYNFSKEKLVIANDISISILNYNNIETEKFIWLNLNPKKFINFKFSPDLKVLLLNIDDNNIILYNCSTGEIIRKFKNENKYPLMFKMVPSSSDFGIFVLKSDNNSIKIYNYNNGVELMDLNGFNAYSFCFSEKGDLLSCGCLNGNEITRVWNLLNNEFYSYFYDKGNNNNKNTLVKITKSLEPKIICVSEKQNPIVFDLDSKKILLICNSPFIFEKITKISCSKNDKFFFVKGSDISGKNLCAVFSLENGKKIEKYNNCNLVHFGDGNLILSKSENNNNGNLVISDLNDLNNIIEIKSEINSDISYFLQDKKTIVSTFLSQDKIKFILNDVNDGEIIGNVEYEKIKGNHSEVNLSVNIEENSLIFTYIELVDRNLN